MVASSADGQGRMKHPLGGPKTLEVRQHDTGQSGASSRTVREVRGWSQGGGRDTT